MVINIIHNRLIPNLKGILDWVDCQNGAHTRGNPKPVTWNDTSLICRGRYMPSRMAMAAPIEDKSKLVNYWNFFTDSIRNLTRECPTSVP